MRILLTLVLSGTLAIVGCGSDDGDGAAGTGGDGMGGSGGNGAAGTGGSGGGNGGGARPEITEVSWVPVSGCVIDQESQYTITVTVQDPDSTVPDDILYDGSVGGCNPGEIDDVESTVTCPNVADYSGSVVVEDETDNVSDRVTFTLPNDCQPGSHTP